jgi:hypothetical protein
MKMIHQKWTGSVIKFSAFLNTGPNNSSSA